MVVVFGKIPFNGKLLRCPRQYETIPPMGHTRFVIALLFAASALAQRPATAVLKQETLERIGARAKLVQEITDSIFSFSELGYQEFETAKYITGILRDNGFRIQQGAAGMPSAFVAEWGSGKPIIGLMADVDGLPETSQKPGVAYHAPLIEGGPGHGEGHNAGQAVEQRPKL